MSAHISRHLANRLRGLAAHFPVVLLTGARQTGKTTLLRDLYPEAPFLTLDLPSVAYDAETNGMGFLDSLAEHRAIVLDEVQYAPALFRHLKVAVDADRHRMGRFLMTGSQKFALMQSISESLAGRCAILEMDTLSAAEIHDAFQKDAPSVENFIWRGGYPELWRSVDMPTRDFFAGYLATYLERDVRQLVNVVNLRDFERFIRYCATYSGGLVNLARLGADVGVAATTAKQWLSVLEASNIIHLLPPYFRNHGRRVIKTPKLYFKDTGLLCFLLGIHSPSQMKDSPFIGAIWETFVLGEMLRAIQAEGSPAEIYFWRDAQGVEVDFAVWLNGRLQFVEAKWTEGGDDLRHLKPMHTVRTILGDNAADRHLLACRTPHDHWHPRDPSVRLVHAYRFRDWFHVPAPPENSLREEPAVIYGTKKKVGGPAARKKKKS